ncbi:MAG: BON domain-containing protein [Betaproteobacteria bacterium]
MSQQHPENPRKRSLLLPFGLGAFAVAVMVVACERPGTHAALATPEAYAQRAAPTVQRGDFDNTASGASTSPRYASPDAISDTVISGKIKASILTDPGMSGADVSVNTDHGVVTLTGNVKSQEQTAIASAHAQRQDGVMRVDNHLSLNPQ